MRIMRIVAVLLTLSLEYVVSHEIEKRYIGANNAKSTENRFTVWIEKAGEPLYTCSGALLAEDWVLTAANCFDPNELLSSYKIIAGDNIKNVEDGEVVIQPDAYILHPDYDSITLANNLALVHLSQNASASADTIELVERLSTENLDALVPNKDRCKSSSFGPDDTGVPIRRMQTLTVKVQENSMCDNLTNYNTSSNLCYTGDPGAPCSGDEGSPIVCMIGPIWTLVGVHSVGSCANGSHAASRVSFYRSWIINTMAKSAPVSCTAPPVVANGTFVSNGTNVENDEAVLVCDNGYSSTSDVVSDYTITCGGKGAWSFASASCAKKSCGALPATQNGTFDSIGTNVVNDTATINCDEGFLLSSVAVADSAIKCQDDGSWSSTEVTCLRSCGTLPTSANGSYSLEGRNVVNSTAVLTCDGGFVPSASDVADYTLVCGSDGSWSSLEVFCIRSCGALPATQNGTFDSIGTNVVNDTATINCDEGFLLSSVAVADSAIKCQDDGSWSSTEVTCLRSCGTLPTSANGSYSLEGRNVVNSTAVLTCDGGFVPSASDVADYTLVCGSDGSWSSSEVFCIRSCGALPATQNGTFDSIGTNVVNDTATINCDEGFFLSSVDVADSAIKCQDDGSWSSTEVTCLRSCGTLPTSANGSYSLEGRNVVNSTAVLTCDGGFVPSASDVADYTLVCGSDGSWSSSDVACIRSCGSVVAVANGDYVSSGNDTVGDTATLTCNSGFRISSAALADSAITCQPDGSWSSHDVICEKECGSAGTSFMFGFFGNNYPNGRPFIHVMTNEPTKVTINVPHYSHKITYTLRRYAKISLSNIITGAGNEELSNKGVEITSELPITVYAQHYRGGRSRSAEGTLILPSECSSTDYLVVTHGESPYNSMQSQFMIFGITNDTHVSIDLPSGETKNVTLDRHGSYQYREEDLTGAIIRADSPVVALAGHACAYIPDKNVSYCDSIVEQMPPLLSLKKAYIISYMKPRPNFSVRVVAAYDDTDVVIRDTTGVAIQNISLNKAESYFITFEDRETISITSNQGVLVAQYAHGMSSDSNGDPSMVVLPGLGQFENNYNIRVPRGSYEGNFVSIVMSNVYDITGLRLGRRRVIDSVNENRIAISVPGYGEYTVVHVQPSLPWRKLTHTDSEATFGAVLYGFNVRVGYSWLAGRVV